MLFVKKKKVGVHFQHEEKKQTRYCPDGEGGPPGGGGGDGQSLARRALGSCRPPWPLGPSPGTLWPRGQPPRSRELGTRSRHTVRGGGGTTQRLPGGKEEPGQRGSPASRARVAPGTEVAGPSPGGRRLKCHVLRFRKRTTRLPTHPRAGRSALRGGPTSGPPGLPCAQHTRVAGTPW